MRGERRVVFNLGTVSSNFYDLILFRFQPRNDFFLFVNDLFELLICMYKIS